MDLSRVAQCLGVARRGIHSSRLLRLVVYRLHPLVRLYFRLVTEFRYRTQLQTKGIHPRRTYTADPKAIQQLLAPNTPFSVANSGEIHGGDWDRRARSFDDYLIYNSLKNRFVHGYEWDETEQFERARETIDAGGSCWHGCRSLSDLRDRCAYLDALYTDIKDHGYTPQSELEVRRHENASIYPPSLREISVAIGRNGELILLDGRHRVSIVKIVGVDRIPIQIAIVHAEWDGGLPAGVTDRTPDPI